MDWKYSPVSTSTTPEGVAQDLADRQLRAGQRLGRLPATLGVTRPGPKVRNMAELHQQMGGYLAQQRAVYGGYAADGRDTTVEQSYRQRRWDFLSKEEAVRESAYDDASGRPIGAGEKRGNATIGVGFNMERKDARKIFGKVLGIQGADYDAIYSGRAGLSQTQIRKLFDYTADEAEAHVAKKLEGVDLREHQRLALVSLAFNAPALIGPKLAGALREGRMRDAIREITHNSGAVKDARMRGRRSREAMMLAGHGALPQLASARPVAYGGDSPDSPSSTKQDMLDRQLFIPENYTDPEENRLKTELGMPKPGPAGMDQPVFKPMPHSNDSMKTPEWPDRRRKLQI